MPDYGTPPAIPTALQQYNSYETDPKWQRKFTYIWVTALGVVILFSILRPRSLLHLKRSLYAPSGAPTSFLSRLRSVFGIWEKVGRGYELISSGDHKGLVRERRPHSQTTNKGGLRKIVERVEAGIWGLFGWSLPGIELDFGQILIIVGYVISAILCVVLSSELVDNPNRAGFMALAQLPVVFLFSTKNSLLTILSSAFFSYDKINFIHRWSGRALFLCALLHGALWISNHLVYGLPILGQQKETSGVAAFGVLCVLVLSSLRWVRRLWWEGFFFVHVLGYVAFFVTACYHTIYAPPWIFPPLAFLGFDYLMRLVRYRFKDATLVPVDQNMTLIHIHDCDEGWKAGQHIRLRVFLGHRIFETHPLTIANAAPSSSCLDTPRHGRGNGVVLAARVVGDWTRAINSYASEERNRLIDLSPKEKLSFMTDGMNLEMGAPIQVMIDGPYGGPSIDLGEYENVLLVAGGSGASFSVGVLDDIVGRCVFGRPNEEKTRRIEFVWYIKSFGCIQWFAPMLTQIANTVANSRAKIHAEGPTPTSSALPLDLHISIFVTCLCDPEAVLYIPNSDVTVERPSASKVVKSFTSPPVRACGTGNRRDSTATKESSSEIDSAECGGEEGGAEVVLKGKLDWVGLEGGVGVCVSGPEGLIRETGNAVSLLGLRGGGGVGKIGIHTELFAM